MPRPVKLRKVEYDYQNMYFVPCAKGTCGKQGEEIQLKVEELEAIRLKDIEALTQEECAERMNVSRQTFQNIIDQARKKVAMALIGEKAIAVGGGSYTKNICSLTCQSCGNEMRLPVEGTKICGHCGSEYLACITGCATVGDCQFVYR